MIHEQYMQRCLDLAKMGRYYAAPNPMVGAVLVYENRIIGEGYHEKYGEGHAEVNAFASVLPEDEKYIKESTLYVSLEPCAFFGKTPPCAKLVVEKQVPKVVLACTDPHPKVAGNGIAKMEEAGIEVITGCLEAEAIELNRRFFTSQTKQRPFVVLKWAQSKDGFMAKDTGEPVWISNELSKRYTHSWRAEENAIMVGRRTAALDNPSLTVRHWTGKNPIRVVLDRLGQLPNTLNIFDGEAPTLIFTNSTEGKDSTEKVSFHKVDFSKEILLPILHHLHHKNVLSILVEGGPSLLNSFIDLNLWDEARIFTGSKSLGVGLSAPQLKIPPISEEKISDNLLSIYRNNHDQ